MSMTRWWLWAWLLLGPAAWAQDDTSQERARELYQNGRTLYEEGEYESAIMAFKQGYDLSKLPAFLYNIANAYERLGDFEQAIAYLNQYRALASADERETLERRIRAMEKRLAETPAPAPEPESAPAAQGPATASGPAPTTSGPTPGTSSASASARGGVVLLGASGGLLATGAIFGVRASSAREEALGMCVEQGGGLLCPGTAATALRRETVSAVVADSALVLGGAGLLGGAALLVFRDVSVSPMPGGVLIRGQF